MRLSRAKASRDRRRPPSPWALRPLVIDDDEIQMSRLIESISGATQIAGHLLLYPLLSGWRRRWGTMESERTLRLPGDELVPEPDWSYNHAVSIGAPRAAVWPWLVQVGQGRGGFYSYDGLENLAGCQIRNVLEIRPALQQLQVGDRIVLHGRSGFGPEVVRLEPERAWCSGVRPTRRARKRPGLSTCSRAGMARRDCLSGGVASPAGAWARSSASGPI